jgi:hypothetical protein
MSGRSAQFSSEQQSGPSGALPSVSGLVVEYVPATDETRVRFPADALSFFGFFAFYDAGAPPLPLGGSRNGFKRHLA